jgi:hypothetical protein
MYFRSEKHRELFKDATKKMDKKDNVQMCVVYLLTADKKLWNRCKIYIVDNKIPIHRVRVGKCTEEGYTLFCVAKDLALGTKHLTMNDLSDKELIPTRLWKIIYTATEIRRMGLTPLQYYKGDNV